MYNSNFWDKRYASSEYLYGTEPNTFLAENVELLHGHVLSLSEGEGRNAVFLANHGLRVTGVDCSKKALEKAQKLAAEKGVKIKTQIADLADYTPRESEFGAVVSISAHLPSPIRKRLYPLIEKSLKPNGIFILEAYAESQIQMDTGGPKDIDMLMSIKKLRRELPNLKPILAREIERHVSEGKGHTGLASVVQFIAVNEIPKINKKKQTKF